MDTKRRTNAQYNTSSLNRHPPVNTDEQRTRPSTSTTATHKRIHSRVDAADPALDYPTYVNPDEPIPTDLGAPRLTRSRVRLPADPEKRKSRARSQSPSLAPSSPLLQSSTPQTQTPTQMRRTRAPPTSRLSISESTTQAAHPDRLLVQRSADVNTRQKQRTERGVGSGGNSEFRNSKNHPFYPVFNDGSLVFTPAYTDFAPAQDVIMALTRANIGYAVGVDVVPTYSVTKDLKLKTVSAAGSDKEDLKKVAEEFAKEVAQVRQKNARVAILCGDKTVCPMFLAYFLISKHKWTVDGALFMILTSWVDAYPNKTCLEILNELENKKYGKTEIRGAKVDVFTFHGVHLLPTTPAKRQALFNRSWLSWMQSSREQIRQDDFSDPVPSHFYPGRHIIGGVADALLPEYLQKHNIVGAIVLGIHCNLDNMSDDVTYKRISIENDSQDLLSAINITTTYLRKFNSRIEEEDMKDGNILICDNGVGSLAVCVYAGVLMQACQSLSGAYTLGLRPAFEIVCKKATNTKLDPEPGFIAQLRAYERTIRAHSLGTSPFGNSAHRLREQQKQQSKI